MKLWRFITRNFGYKLLALASAAALWYAFANEAEIATSIPVSVQYKNLPEDIEITSESFDRLFLRVRGPAARVSTSSLAGMGVVFDLSDVQREGERTFAINEKSLDLPSGVRLLRVVPSQVRLTLERRERRHVPVEIRYAGLPPAGYRVGRQTIVPREVEITGPGGRVRQVNHATTDPIDLAATVGEAEFRVPVFLGDPQVRLAEPVPTVVVRVFLEKIQQ